MPDQFDVFWSSVGHWPWLMLQGPTTDRVNEAAVEGRPERLDDPFQESEVDSIVGILRDVDERTVPVGA